jgi:hypothetical protein
VDGHAALAYEAGYQYIQAAQKQGPVLNPALIAAQLRTESNPSAQGRTVRMLHVDQSGRVTLAFNPVAHK